MQLAIAAKGWDVTTNNLSPLDEGFDEEKVMEQEQKVKRELGSLLQDKTLYTYEQSHAFLKILDTNNDFLSEFMLRASVSLPFLNKLRYDLVGHYSPTSSEQEQTTKHRLSEDRFWACFFFHVDVVRERAGMLPLLSLVDRYDRELARERDQLGSTSPLPPPSSSSFSSLAAEPPEDPASTFEKGEDNEVEYVSGLFGFTTVEQRKKRPIHTPSAAIKQPFHLSVVQKDPAKPPLAPCRRYTVPRSGIKSSSLSQKDHKRPSSGAMHTSTHSEQLDRKRRRHIVKVGGNSNNNRLSPPDSGSDQFVMLSGQHSCGSGSESGGFSSPWETLTASA